MTNRRAKRLRSGEGHTGLIAAFAGSRYVESMLFNVTAADPRTYAVAAAVVVMAALAGCILPAIRAVRVDPVVALKVE